jgi:hypothetical protein
MPNSSMATDRAISKSRRPKVDRANSSGRDENTRHQSLLSPLEAYCEVPLESHMDMCLPHNYVGAALDKAARSLDGGSSIPVNRDANESFERTPVGSGDEEDLGVSSYRNTTFTQPDYVDNDFYAHHAAQDRDAIMVTARTEPYRSLDHKGPNIGREDDNAFLALTSDLSPAAYDRVGLNYVNTPSESGSALASIYNHNGKIVQMDQKAYGSQAEAGPSTIGSTNLSLPVHELQSGTLGDIGRIYPSFYATYTSPPAEYLSSVSPNISGLLNPDPLSRAALLPTFAQPRSPLDTILPRPLLHLIIGLFKDFVYPLTPCIHMPTLIQDLAKRREMEAGQEEWTAMVLATVMSTVVQVPRAFVPLSRGEVSALAERCHMETRKWSISGYSDSITVNAGK